jgi:PAS domain S-box-containing protein
VLETTRSADANAIGAAIQRPELDAFERHGRAKLFFRAVMADGANCDELTAFEVIEAGKEFCPIAALNLLLHGKRSHRIARRATDCFRWSLAKSCTPFLRCVTHVKEAATIREPVDCRAISVPLLALVLLCALLVLIGWTGDWPELRSLGPGVHEMKPFTAVLFIITCALGLMQALAPTRLRKVRLVLAGILFLFAALFALQGATHIQTGVERLLFPKTVSQHDSQFGGLMSMATAVAFLFIAASTICALANKVESAGWLLAPPAAIGALALLGYGYEVRSLYELGPFASIALHTAASLFTVSIALWCSLRHNRLLQLFVSDTPHARMLRRIGPAIVLVPFLLGILQTRLVKSVAVPSTVANAIVTLLEITVLGALLAVNLVSIYREQQLRAAAEADREQYLRRLTENEERMRMAFAAGNMGWWEFDIKTGAGRAAPETAAMFGLSRDQTRGGLDLVRPRIHPDDRERWWRGFQEAMHEVGDYRAQYRVLPPDGSVRWIASRGRVLPDEKGEPQRIIGVVIDITEVRRAEEAVRESERKFRRIFETANEGIWVLDANARITMANARIAEMLGYSVEELIGRGKADLVFSPEDREIAREQIESRKRNVAGSFEVRLRHRDGSAVWAQFSARPIFEDGKFSGVLDMIADITERKRAEEELARAQAELQQHAATLEQRVEQRTAELRDTIGQLEAFSYSITHDMRGPLRAISGFAGILALEYGPQLDENARLYIERMSAATARLDALIQDVLNYSRISKGELGLEPIDLCALVQDIVHQYPDLAAKREHIELNCGHEHVCGNLAALTQVISNLMGNALKFVPPDRAPRVRVETELRDDRLRLWVIDNGLGIPAEYQDKIWGAFQRLHKAEEFPGTGIGLAIVKKAMERMNGAVGVESQEGIGSRFWVELPLAPVSMTADQPVAA